MLLPVGRSKTRQNGINISFEIGFKEESFNRFLVTKYIGGGYAVEYLRKEDEGK